jgi:hypothetical protein
LILCAGVMNGTMDKLQFHYGKSVFKKAENQYFWNPKISWENKYLRDAEGSLVRPLRPKHFGSTTFLVWTTDAWHLFQTIFFACWRTAVVILAAGFYRISPRRFWNTAAWIAVWLGLMIVQSIGFHLMYNYFLKA